MLADFELPPDFELLANYKLPPDFVLPLIFELPPDFEMPPDLSGGTNNILINGFSQNMYYQFG